MSQLFRRKPIAALLVDETDTAHSLKRVLGAGDLVMLAIGAVIGAGIFGSIGQAAAGQIGPHGEVIRVGAGPALVLSFILLGACCALAGLCYAELAAMIPAGGQRLRLLVRDARRAGGLDHRLGPDSGVRRRQRRRGDFVGRLLQVPVRRLDHVPGVAHDRLPHGAAQSRQGRPRAARHRSARLRAFRFSSTCRRSASSC